MRRREVITMRGGGAAGPVVASAQTKRARIGWFTVAPHPYIDGFRLGLRELGWIEGESFAIEHIYADGHPERLPGLASALARASPTIWLWFRVLTPSKRRARQFTPFPSWVFPAPWASAEAWRGQKAT